MNITEEKSENPGITKKRCVPVIEKLKHLQSTITVEPMLLFFVVPTLLNNFSSLNLRLEKVCRVNLNYSTVICDALSRREIDNYTE